MRQKLSWIILGTLITPGKGLIPGGGESIIGGNVALYLMGVSLSFLSVLLLLFWLFIIIFF